MFNKKKKNFIEPKTTVEYEDEDSVAYFNRLYENTFNPEGRVTKSSSLTDDKLKETDPTDLYSTLDTLYVNENDFEGYVGELYKQTEDELLKQKDYINNPSGTSSNSKSTEEASSGKKKPFYKNISYISDAVGGIIGQGLGGAVRTYGEWDYALDMHKAKSYLKKAEKSTDEKEKAEYMKKYEEQKNSAEFFLNGQNEVSKKIQEYGESFSTTDKTTDNKVLDKANQVIKGGISSLASMGAGAVLSGGNPMIGMGVTSYGSAKNEAENMGIENATQYALINAVIETGSELVLPGSKGLKTLFTTGSLKEAFKVAGTESAEDFLREVAKEYGQESLTELAHIFHEGFYVDGNGEDIGVKSMAEGFDRVNTAGLTGAFMGGITTGTANINSRLNGTYEPKAKTIEDDTPTNPYPEVPTKIIEKAEPKTIAETMADDINKALGTDAITEEDILNIIAETSENEAENNSDNDTSENTLENTALSLDGTNTPENIENAKLQGENAIEEVSNTEGQNISENISPNTPAMNENAPFLSKTVDNGKEVYITEEGNTVNAKLAEMVAENEGIPIETLTKFNQEDSAVIENDAKASRIIDNIDNSITENGVEETINALNTDVANGSITEEAYNTAMQYVEAKAELTQNDTKQQELTQDNAKVANEKSDTEKLTKVDKKRQEITKNDTAPTDTNANNVRYNNPSSSNTEIKTEIPKKVSKKVRESQEKIDKITKTKTFKDTFKDTELKAVEKLNVEQKTAEKLAKEIGRDVVFYEAEGKAPNGFFKEDTLYINNSFKGDNLMSVLGHETFHSLKNTDTKTFNELVKWGEDNFSTREINKFLSKIDNEAEVERLSNNPKLLSEEMLAESFGTDFANKEFWNSLETTNKTLFDKIKDFVFKILKKAENNTNDFLTKKHIKELRSEFESILGKLTDTEAEVKTETKTEIKEEVKEAKYTDNTDTSKMTKDELVAYWDYVDNHAEPSAIKLKEEAIREAEKEGYLNHLKTNQKIALNKDGTIKKLGKINKKLWDNLTDDEKIIYNANFNRIDSNMELISPYSMEERLKSLKSYISWAYPQQSLHILKDNFVSKEQMDRYNDFLYKYDEKSINSKDFKTAEEKLIKEIVDEGFDPIKDILGYKAKAEKVLAPKKESSSKIKEIDKNKGIENVKEALEAIGSAAINGNSSSLNNTFYNVLETIGQDLGLKNYTVISPKRKTEGYKGYKLISTTEKMSITIEPTTPALGGFNIKITNIDGSEIYYSKQNIYPTSELMESSHKGITPFREVYKEVKNAVNKITENGPYIRVPPILKDIIYTSEKLSNEAISFAKDKIEVYSEFIKSQEANTSEIKSKLEDLKSKKTLTKSDKALLNKYESHITLMTQQETMLNAYKELLSKNKNTTDKMLAPKSKNKSDDDVKFSTRKGKEFNEWFEGSVMVKENGKPEIYYHTTNAVFDDFNDNAETKNGKKYGAGHYFTNKRTQPGYGYGKNRLSVNLDIKNPLDFSKQINIEEARKIAIELDNKFGTAKYNEYRADKLERTINTYGENGKIPVFFFSGAISIENSDYRDVLLKYGYDGIVEYSGGEQYIVAFSNDQVNVKTRVDEDGVRFSTRTEAEIDRIKTPLLEMAGKVNDLQLRTGIKSIYKMGINKNVNLVETFKDAINMLASNTDDAITNQKSLENSLLDKGISARESYILSKYFTNIVEVAKEKVAKPTINSEYVVSTSSNTESYSGINTNGNSSSTINQVITSTNWKGQKGPLIDRIGMGIERAYSRIADTFHFAKKIAGDEVYRKARLTNTSFGIAENILTNNLTDKNGNVVDASLKDMLAEVMTEGKELEIMDYALHKHNMDRATQEKYVFYNEDGTPVSSAQSSEIVAKYEAENPDFKVKSERLTGWINTFMKTWGVDTGILSEDLYNVMLNMYPSYVPTNRELNDHLELFGGSYGGKGFVDKSKPVKKLAEGGSARNIIDIRESLVNLVTKTVRTAKMNEVGQSLLQAIRTNPEMEGVASIVSKPEGDNPNVVRVLENGEAVYVEIHNQDLLNMLEKVHTPEYGDITEAVKTINNGVKQLITTKNPLFALTNTARDYQTYMVNSSEVSLRKRWSNLQEALSLIQQDIAGKDMTGTKLALYNAMGVNASGIMAKSSHKTIENLTGRKSLINQNTGAIEGYTNISDLKKNWTKIMDGLETLTGSTETAFRLAEFIGAINRGESIEEATLKSMEVTVDFSRSGDLTKQADAYVKYLNAGVQGLDNFVRKVAENPSRVLTRSLVHIAGPALILAAFNSGDDEYEMLDDRTKDNNFLLSLAPFGKEGQFIKIPKAREYGMVAMLAERLVYGRGFKNLGRSITENISPPSPISDNILSDIGKYGDDQAKDFAGRYIVPRALQEYDKKDQWDEDTTVLSKWLGQITGLSPKKLDYYLDSYTGILGDSIMPMFTPSTYTNKEDVLGKSTSFITNKFVADNTRSSSSSGDYYDNLDEMTKIVNNEQRDLSTEEKQKYKSETEEIKSYIEDEYGKDITALNKMLKDNTLTKEEIKEIKKLRNQAMKKANETAKMFLSPRK